VTAAPGAAGAAPEAARGPSCHLMSRGRRPRGVTVPEVVRLAYPLVSWTPGGGSARLDGGARAEPDFYKHLSSVCPSKLKTLP